ncbi:MAG: type II/IV secretion system protein [Phycisphaerales bacterium]|nr:type II/IV secretion system protein [Phycisphaerales bacterium]
MGKFDVERLLQELGVNENADNAPARPDPEQVIADRGDSIDALVPIQNGAITRTRNISQAMLGSHGATGASGVMDESRLTLMHDPGEDHFDPDASLKKALLEGQVCSPREISNAETVIKQTPGANLVETLRNQGLDDISLLKTVAHVNSLEFVRIDADADMPFDDELVSRLGIDYCKAHLVAPLGRENGRVVIAMARPDDVFTLDDARLRLQASLVKVVVAPTEDLRNALESITSGDATEDLESILGDVDEDDVQVERSIDEEVDLEREAGESPVIRYVNYIIQNAVKEGASDIHIEPGDKAMKVRFRIDGILFEMMNPPVKMAPAIISRLKIMANLDISERRVPQDGRIRCVVQNRKLDLRMSTLPCAGGEKVVMRILDTKSINVSLDDLGFDEDTLTIWKKQVEEPHGIVLVTGPTGSGKTTTLYASLRQMDKNTLNVSTVEDPIEYHLDGITQTQTHEKIGMTFARALKSLLRQDPDIIMVGEIRDQETAHTAVQAALTGHLVLSTLHTNDAPSAITRLVNIGLEPFLIGAAVNAVLAQRLVRRICPNCRTQSTPTDEMLEFLELQGLPANALFEGAGCDKCRNTGYQGRVGIYEMLVVTDHLRDMIARNPNVTEFRRLCRERGMVTLREDGLKKVSEGLTTIEEVLRVTEAGV